MNRLLTPMLGLVFAAIAVPAMGQDPAAILSARKAGLIGERFDGYLGIVGPAAPADLRRQVGAVNIRRRALYSDLAARRGVSPEEVGITAACTLLGRIGVGEYYLAGEGSWQRVVAGQSPVPGYCGGSASKLSR